MKVSAVVLLSLIAAITAQNCFRAASSSENETTDPGVTATGTAYLRIQAGGNVDYAIQYPNAVTASNPITALHFHPGAAGEDNPPVYRICDDATPNNCSDYNLGPGPNYIFFNDLDFDAECNSTCRDNIIANPELYYFNLHTQDQPSGLIRGQFETFACAEIDFGELPNCYASALDSANVVPTAPSSSATATMWWQVAEDRDVSLQVSYGSEINSDNEVTAFRIYDGVAGMTGPAVLTFCDNGECSIPDGPFDRYTTDAIDVSAQCDATCLDAIAADSHEYYVQVITSAETGGQYRGQGYGISCELLDFTPTQLAGSDSDSSASGISHWF